MSPADQEELNRAAVEAVDRAAGDREAGWRARVLGAVLAIAAGQLAWLTTHAQAAATLRNVARALDTRGRA